MKTKSLKDHLEANQVEMFGNIKSEKNNLTVLVTTFNHERFIKQTLNSILGQDVSENFQIVIFDDASTDSTRKTLLEFHYANPLRVTLLFPIFNRLSRGLESTIFALELIESEYVAFCEGDDYWLSTDKLARQLEFMRTNQGWCSVSHHDIYVEKSSTPSQLELMQREPWVRSVRTSGSVLSEGNFIFTCSVMLRREALRDDVLRIVNGKNPGDYILFSLAAEKGDIGFVEDIYSCYRHHENNMWLSLADETRLEKTQNVKWFLAGVLDPEISLAFRKSLLRPHVSKIGRLENYTKIFTMRFTELMLWAKRLDKK
jgi:glycosyltransferase involved in cell wall biosynthesis